MHEQPDSYGTGRAPEKKASHLSTILLLLAAFVATHFITFLHLSSRSEEPKTNDDDALRLSELMSESDAGETPVSDGCGLGLELSDLSEPQRKYWSLPSGVFVEQIDSDSTAYAAGLRAGDVLVQVGETTVDSVEDCLEALCEYQESNAVPLHYYRSGTQYSTTISFSPTE